MNWISVKDKLPEENQRVLTYNSNIEEIRTAYLEKAGCKVDYSIYTEDDLWVSENHIFKALRGYITHWMPLPEKPE
jgi:Protein of unknown function (DUF551)